MTRGNIVKHFFKHLWVSFVFFIAHCVYFFERLLALPQYVFLVCFILFTLIASAIYWNPFLWEKTALAISPQKPQHYTQLLHVAQMFGDPQFAEAIYASMIPQLNQDDRATLYAAAYPLEYLEKSRLFWSKILQLQPSSREAYAALTLIHYSLQENDAERSTVETWKLIEPNDERITVVERALNPAQ